MMSRTLPNALRMPITLAIGMMTVAVFGQDMVFRHGFESPIKLTVATFNTRFSFDGTIIDNRYVANPANVQTTIDKFNELNLDLAGLQEVHDYAALETLAAGTERQLAAALTDVHYIFPPAVLSSLKIVSQLTYNGSPPVVETGVLMPDGTLIYVFSIHQAWDRSKRVHNLVNSEILRRRLGSHPVLVFGDMNGNTNYMLEHARGSLQVIYDVNIDAILGTAHFQRVGEGVNHGNLGFSDHPLLVADISYTPGSQAQSQVTAINDHIMPPDATWEVGPELVPDPSVLTAIRITHLPEKGELKLGPDLVALNEVIPAAQIHDLKYTTDPGDIGKDYWVFDIIENPPPPVPAPRWVDVFIQDRISNIRFHKYTDISPDTDSGWGWVDLDYANEGAFIYPHDDGQQINYDVFNANLPDELKGLLFIRNGGRHEHQWQREYMHFDLPQPTQVYLAISHRADGTPRDYGNWTKQWDSVSFNAGNALPYDIYSQCLDAGEVMLWGNHTSYDKRYIEENMVLFIGGSCDNPVPGCDNMGGHAWWDAAWLREARDCAREDCASDGRWRSRDGKVWCRSLIVKEFEDWTINTTGYGLATFHFYTDWGDWDGNDCGDGKTTIRIPECGLEEEVLRGGVEQQHYCNVSGLESITIQKEKGICEYVIIGNPWFD